jgi:hypothetical protein
MYSVAQNVGGCRRLQMREINRRHNHAVLEIREEKWE